MAYQNAPCLQVQIQCLAGIVRRGGKDEIGFGINHPEAEITKLPGGPIPDFGNGGAVFPEVVRILQSAHACGHGGGVDVVGIGGILYGIQIPDQFFAADAETQPCTGHGAGLGKGLGDEEVAVFSDEGDSAFSAKVHVGLVDHHHIVRVGGGDPLDVSQGNGQPGGGVGIGNENGFMDAHIVLHPKGKVLRQGNRLIGNAVQICEDRIETVGDVRECGGTVPVAEGHEGEIQNFITAVGKENFVFLNAVVFAGRRNQLPALRVGVELKVLRCLRRQLHRQRRGRKRGFVGIQLDVLHLLGLLSRGVGYQGGIFLTEKTAHASSSRVRIRALLAWPVRPSALAK